MTPDKWIILGWVALYVTFASANLVLYKVMFDKFQQRYAFFVSQFTTLFYDIFAISFCLYEIYIRKSVTPEMRRFPKKVFLVMGLMDGASGFFGAIGTTNSPAQWLAILNQLAIPTTVLCCYFILKRRYEKLQYWGSLVIFLGAVLTVVPGFISPKSTSSNVAHWKVVVSVIIYTLSVIPQAANTVYKEISMKKVDLNVYYLTAWVSVFQLLLSFIYTPLLAIPGFGGIKMADVPESFYNGLKCFGGINSVLTGDNPDDCHMAWMWMVLYCSVNFIYNIAGLIVYKKASAVVAAIGGAIRIPLANAVFAMHFMGKFQEGFTVWDVLGLGVVLGGMLMYSIPEAQAEDAEHREDGFEKPLKMRANATGATPRMGKKQNTPNFGRPALAPSSGFSSDEFAFHQLEEGHNDSVQRRRGSY